jgi:hypothetical protein
MLLIFSVPFGKREGFVRDSDVRGTERWKVLVYRKFLCTTVTQMCQGACIHAE